jgi:hypothetical protein
MRETNVKMRVGSKHFVINASSFWGVIKRQ